MKKKFILWVILILFTNLVTNPSYTVANSIPICVEFETNVIPESDWKMPKGIVHHKLFEDYGYWAVRFGNIYGDPPSVKLAQMAIESTWGKSDLSTIHNNYFGITCQSCKPSVKYKDKDADGNKVYHFFMVYKSPWASMKSHSIKVGTNSWYADCKEFSKCYDPGTIAYSRAWIKGLQDDKLRWAQDRKYAEKLIRIIIQYKLYLLDDINLYK